MVSYEKKPHVMAWISFGAKFKSVFVCLCLEGVWTTIVSSDPKDDSEVKDRDRSSRLVWLLLWLLTTGGVDVDC